MVEPENRGNGRWKIRACAGYKGAEKQMKSMTIYLDPKKTEGAQLKEARKQTAQLEADLAAGRIKAGKSMTLAEYSDHWMDSYCRRKKRALGTIKGYQDLLKWRILPQLGKVKLRDITPLVLNRFITGLEKETPPLSGTYIRKYFNLLHLMLRCAAKEQLIPFNPADNIEAPVKDTQQRRPYDEEQVAQLVVALEEEPPKWRAYILLALDSQMRRGEIIGLNWSDIDFEHRTVNVQRSCAYVVGAGQYLKEPKTKAGNRTIYIDAQTLDALSVWMKEQRCIRFAYGSAWMEPDAIFTQEDGSRMSVCSPTKWFPLFLKRHELPHMNLHGLRHTGASLLVAHKEDYARVSRRLGHSRTSTTMDIYAHAYAEKDAELSGTLSQILYKKEK